MIFYDFMQTTPQLTEIKIVKNEVPADLCIQTYGQKKKNYTQAANSEKICRVLEYAIENNVSSVYFDSLYSIAYDEKLEIMLKYACIKEIQIFSQYMR